MSQTPADNPSGQQPQRRSALPDMVFRSPRDYALMFRERWHWGMLVAILLANVIIYLEYQKDEAYYAEALLEFATTPENVLPGEQLFTDREDEYLLERHLRHIASRRFLVYAMQFFTDAEKERITQPYWNGDGNERPRAMGVVREGMEIFVEEDDIGPFIHVGMKHREPQVAEMVANRLATRYIEYHDERTKTESTRAIENLEQRKRELQTKLSDTRRAIQKYREENTMVDQIGEFMGVIGQRVDALSADLIDAEADLRNLRNVLAEIEAYREQDRDLTQLAAVANDPSVNPYLVQLQELQSEKRLLAQRYLERHPSIKQINERIAAARELVDENIQELTQRLASDVTLAEQRVQRIRDDLTKAEKEQLQLEGMASELTVLQNDVQQTEDALARVSQRLEDAIIQGEGVADDVVVLEPAQRPLRPVEPDLPGQMVWAGMAGVLAFVLVPLALGLLDYRLKTQWEIEEFLGTTLLGEIPKLSGVHKKRRPHVAAGKSQPTLCESFRGLYGRMELSMTKPCPKVILLCSTVPSEGKSLVANNLAYTFARHGRNVLLVDSDFRGPSLHGYHNLDNSKGILPWLHSNGELPEDVRTDDNLGIHAVAERFDLLCSGGQDKQPTEFFSNPRLKSLFDSLRSLYDVILVDTPPVGVFPDALLLKPFVDEAVFVCRFRKVNKFRVRHFLDKMTEAGHSVEGVVLNGLPPGRLSSYYGYHGYGANSESEYNRYYAKKA